MYFIHENLDGHCIDHISATCALTGLVESTITITITTAGDEGRCQSWCSRIIALSSGLRFLLSSLLLSSYLWFSKFFNSFQIKPHGSVFPEGWSPIPRTALGNGYVLLTWKLFPTGLSYAFGLLFWCIIYLHPGLSPAQLLESSTFPQICSSLGLNYNETLSLVYIIFF